MSGQIERTRIFIEVADRQSFAAAARHLALSRSVVTRQVAELEEALGAQLLVRTTRSVSPTLAGRNYLESARMIVRELDRVSEEVREQQTTMTGKLKVSAPLSFGMRYLPDTIAQFRILYPELTMTMDLTDRFVDILTEDFDMALRISGPPSDVSTIWRKICEVPRGLFAAPDYIDSRGEPRHPADLKDHRCLRYTHSDSPESWRLSHGGKTLDQPVPASFSANNGDLLAALAAAGEGIVMLPDFIVEHHVEHGRLRPVLAEWKPSSIWLTAFYPPYTRLPAKVATFTRFIEDTLAGNGLQPVGETINR